MVLNRVFVKLIKSNMGGCVLVYEFLVKDVSEEYFIVGRILCPRCKGKFKVQKQSLLLNALSVDEQKRIGASKLTDELLCRCLDCGHEEVIWFHLSKDYEKRLHDVAKSLSRAMKGTRDE